MLINIVKPSLWLVSSLFLDIKAVCNLNIETNLHVHILNSINENDSLKLSVLADIFVESDFYFFCQQNWVSDYVY